MLGSTDMLELHFDDLGNRIKNYYYTFQLCNADWSPSILKPFEYIKGFQNARISTYRNSSIATTRYIHYQANIPDRNCLPSRSGNYLLKVFLDNDTTKLVFIKRMVVAENLAGVAAKMVRPYSSTMDRSAQKLNITVQTDSRIQIMSPNDLKVVVLQNNNWQTAVYMDKPTIFRGNYYEYSDETQTVFPGIKEFRWLDLRSLRLKSDRMEAIDNRRDTVKVTVIPDQERNTKTYVYFSDLNGNYILENLDNYNPFWQSDYAWVHFSFIPPGNKPFPGNDLYLFGEMTNYSWDTSGKMNFNHEKGVYEKDLFLKQGFYNYLYALKAPDGNGYLDFNQTEGNYYATQNNYIILVYYRPFGARADVLIASTVVASILDR
jgi:archaellum component FlaG (FlaF/FlaG flagellin family)